EGAVEVVLDAGRHAAGRQRQERAKVELAGTAGAGARRLLAAGAAGHPDVAGAPLVVQLRARVRGVVRRPGVGDRAGERAHAARPLRAAARATRDVDGGGAIADHRGVVRDTGPAGVEHATGTGP